VVCRKGGVKALDRSGRHRFDDAHSMTLSFRFAPGCPQKL
jgi:hypothetical protein